jgi:PEP-CTERM motif
MKIVTRLQLALALAAAVMGANVCNAGSVTYNVNLTIGTGSATGDIVTDGTIGSLTDANIVDWNLEVNENNGTGTIDLVPGNSGLFDHTTVLSATATQLVYDFSGSGLNFFYFVNTNSPPQYVVCFQGSANQCAGPTSGAGEALTYVNDVNNDNPPPQFTSLSGPQAIATTAAVPEAETYAMMLVGLGLVGLAARRRSA